MVLVVTGAALENLMKFKLEKLAKLGFDLKRRNIDLLIEESKAPGRDVSYLVKARAGFPS
jgi:hypothetical protein